MIATLKALSILLCYPTAEIRDGTPDLASAICGEGLIGEPHLATLLAFLSDFGERDLYDLQERYVLLFDRTRSLSLQLFEHVHGESRERGQAMVNLLQLYEQHKLEMEGGKLPTTCQCSWSSRPPCHWPKLGKCFKRFSSHRHGA